jgi:hypothetical protein
MIDHMVQFTKLFRQNDVVWKTGATLSCQYVFAPVLQQRMMILHPQLFHQPQETSKNSSESSSSSNWMEIANDIIETNHKIFQRNASLVTATPQNDSMIRKERDHIINRSNSHVPPFVSDESDNEEDDDSCEYQRRHDAYVEADMDGDDYDNDDVVTSSSDEDTDDDSSQLLSSTPVRTGALPINYFDNHTNQYMDGSNDDSLSYLDRIVATTTSIWTKPTAVTDTVVSKQELFTTPCNTMSAADMKPLVAAYPIDDNTPKKINKLPINVADTMPSDENCTGNDSDDETIPLICFVENQVDAQHSDLWKRSPKCITKAVALGITNHVTLSSPKSDRWTLAPAPPSPPPQEESYQPPPSLDTALSQPTPIDQDRNQHITWWEVFAERAVTTLNLLWNNITTSQLDNNNNSNHIDRSQMIQHHDNNHRHACFWCDKIFPTKASAMQ